MSFIDRILAQDDTHISDHLLDKAFWAFHRGKITRAGFITRLGLLADDEAELDLLIDKHQSLSALEQTLFTLDVGSVGTLVVAGELTSNAQIRTYLDL